ncbi:hypothetical protein A6E12_06770 [Aliivibrio fischeri]|uniref:DUF3427 domain-containing protein n=1 Tax=Aliivibrio fischeri TaxID=668 RepID=UPI00080DF2F8|nr:DUF3427 domain-containing protein [Aliivibrio fischeri]OCH29089.1 hypothetical protein A6E12_06770 [Aliivibrio fischeri]
MAREDEIFQYSKFNVGESFKKLEVMAHAEVSIPGQARDISGIVRYKNCVVLFVTLDKTNKKESEKYYDTFLLDGKKFHWESQGTNTPNTSHMINIFNGTPVILFVRIHEKIKSKSQPFYYLGQLEYLEHRSSAPVEVLYNVINYQERPTAPIEAIYQWEDSNPISNKESYTPVLLTQVKKSSQGRMVDAKKKKAIELHAMAVARDHYSNLGFEVVDTSSNKPYDLECFKGNEFRRVEVKGTTTNGDIVYVTSGEVKSAIDDECETDLFIVSQIHIAHPIEGEYHTSEGIINITENWKPLDKDLEATAYRYTLPV